MKAAQSLSIFLTVVGLSGSAYGEQPGTVSSDKELTHARQLGWHAALIVVGQLAANKQSEFPGIDAWLSDFRNQTAGLDPKADPVKWPNVDADALATRNPRFWRAYYEIAPGDPAAALLYAGLLLGCGETARAVNVIEWQQFRPGIPQGVRKVFGDLLASAKTAGRQSESFVQEGVNLFDKGDYSGAIKKYQEALKTWPQNGWAYYELAYTLRVQEMIAAGVPPELPSEGQVTKKNPDVKVNFSPNMKAAYAQCRRYSPFMQAAYQGDDQEVIRGFCALKDEIVPAMKKLAQAHDPVVVDQALQQLGKGCQEANIHEFALLASQILVARRGRYDPADHPFIATSLRKLVPDADTEAALQRLAAKVVAFHRPIAIEDQGPSHAAERMFTLDIPQYIREKDAQDTFTIVVPIQVQKPEHFENPGLKLAYVIFNQPIKTPPNDLKSVEASYVLNTDKNGTKDLLWQVRSAQQAVAGQAHLFMGAPQYKAVGKKGVLRFGLRGLPDKDIGLFVINNMQPGSNVLVFRKNDFVVGSGDTAFQAAAASLIGQ